MTSYNPQIKIEINEILADGSDAPFEVDFFSGSDQNFHSANKPLHITFSCTSNLGGSQNSAQLQIRNPVYIEKFRKDPQAELDKFKGKKLRIRAWAWYDDNDSIGQTLRPPYQPLFVGDVLDGFSIDTQALEDSAITIQAQGHSWLATSGKMRKTWEPETSFLTIAEEIMLFITEERLQGQETNGSFPYFIVDDELPKRLEEKVLKSPYTVNRNPMEILNDICRDLDYVWGIHNNIPYIVAREHVPQKDKFLIGAENVIRGDKAECNYESGMNGLINYGSDSFIFSNDYDRNLFIGRVVEVSDEPQTGDRGTFVAGRVDQVSGTFDNHLGHRMNILCSYLTEYSPASPLLAKVVLPERRADNSGLRYK